jgi:hypothetical protein
VWKATTNTDYLNFVACSFGLDSTLLTEEILGIQVMTAGSNFACNRRAGSDYRVFLGVSNLYSTSLLPSRHTFRNNIMLSRNRLPHTIFILYITGDASCCHSCNSVFTKATT